MKSKIFATLNEKESRATIRLTAIDQDVFCRINPSMIYPVPNKWGKHGWTHVAYKITPKDILLDALTTAYCSTAPAKLAEMVKLQSEE